MCDDVRENEVVVKSCQQLQAMYVWQMSDNNSVVQEPMYIQNLTKLDTHDPQNPWKVHGCHFNFETCCQAQVHNSQIPNTLTKGDLRLVLKL